MTALAERIGVPVVVQVMLEGWNSLFLVIMIISLVWIRRAGKRSGMPEAVKIPLTDEITVFYITILLYNLLDIICAVTSGDTSGAGRAAKAVGEFGYCAVGAFMTLFFLQMIKDHIAKKSGMKALKNVITAAQCIHIPSLVLLAATPFTGALYTLDEENRYHRGEFFGVWYITTIALFIFAIITLAVYWNKVEMFIRKIVIVGGVVPLLAFLANSVYTGISLNNLAVSVSAMIMFVMYEKDRAAIVTEKVREAQKVRLELAESRNRVLMAQIQPHFINNSLMALRARCVDYPEIYESLTNFSIYLRSNFEALADTKLITFEREMENIEAYLALEKQNFGDRLRVEYDIESDDFLIPALTVQPLVENAVRHGVGTYDNGGTVWIRQYRENGSVVIEVTDDGSGRSGITEQQQKRRGIGIENVRARLRTMSGGVLEITDAGHGTCARITLDEVTEESRE